MNFAKRTHDVVAGKITQVRLPVRYSRGVLRASPFGTDRRPKVGKTFVVKAEVPATETRPAIPAVHAQVTSVRREWLGEIDYAGAKAEGYRTTDDLKVAWTRDHDRAEVSRSEAWALRELGEDGLRDVLLARFVRRHAATEVWVVDFQISEGRDRFLAPGSAGDERGYVTSPGLALDPDASVVDEFTQAAFAKAAEAHRAAQKASFQADLETERRARKNAIHIPPWRRAA